MSRLMNASRPVRGPAAGGTRMLTMLAGAAVATWWVLRRVRTRRISIAGQVALVTGGSRGLGFLVARDLVREGCRVAICARDPAELDRARASLIADGDGQRGADVRGPDVLALTCDVTDAAAVDRLIADVIAHFGRLDILVNNAGIIQVGSLDTLGLADFQQTMAVNFWGTVHTTLAALSQLRRRRGRIVNVTSIGGRVAVPRLLPYDCAKFAAYGFSEGLHAELARDGVSVTTVVPGLMRTGSASFATFKTRGDERWFSIAARTPGLTMHARRAARQIVAALKRRDARAVLGTPAKLLRLANDLVPRLTAPALSAAHRLLPGAARSRGF